MVSGMTRYEKMKRKCEELKIEAPSKKAYSKTAREIKNFIDKLLDIILKRKLKNKTTLLIGNSNLIVKGSWVTSITYPNGKIIEIRGKDLSIEILKEK